MQKKRYGSPTVFAFIFESIKYVIHILIIPMKKSTTTAERQTSTTTSISSLPINSTSRIRQTENLPDYSQVRVYYIQGLFFLSKLRSNSRLSLLFVILAFFCLSSKQHSFPLSLFFSCLLLIIEKEYTHQLDELCKTSM